ncbi:MAG: chitobiase/beta-hexosaminidase C-terminal domain-containing protein [Candidatus Cloacimonadales bacterium]|nr:chitobiase/beta-hexosaminidase C-terminal domain-containing protein [Candidatus Cloacimonadota bacterium]MDX9976902.1 chitobiase/beta-hexosaminidase C-terminal domain-containing protein [Candidatus Cloacimonadales bacterium]
MKVKSLTIKNTMLILLVLFSFGMLYAQTSFTYWDFENSNFIPAEGDGVLTTIGDISYEFLTGFTGSGSGGLALQSTGYPAQGTGNKTAGIQAMVSTVGKENVEISWHQRNSNTGSSRMCLQYTIDGVNWIDFDANAANASNTNTITNNESAYDNGLYIVDAGGTWFYRSASFASIQEVNNNANFGIRIVSAFVSGTNAYGPANPTGSYGTGGTYRYDNITFSSTAGDIVLAPSFDPAGGVYSEPISVSITCPTAGAQIYYTINGDEPTESSTLYSNPITISETTILKAKAYKDNFTPSNTTSATYSFAVAVANLSELRQQNDDGVTIYTVTGEVIVSFTQSFRNQIFVQDANAGILIDDYSNVISTNFNIGDGITGLSGKIETFNGMLQFIPTVNITAPSSSNNPVTAISITIQQLNSNFDMYESRLVAISGLTFVNASGDFEVGSVYPITDGTGNANFRTSFYDEDYIETPVPSGTITMACIPHERVDGRFVASRMLSDFAWVATDNNAIAKTKQLQGNYPNPFNPNTTIAYQIDKSEMVNISIYNCKGQKVVTLVNDIKNAGNHTVNWNGKDVNGTNMPSGIYYYKLQTENNLEVKRAILMK